MCYRDRHYDAKNAAFFRMMVTDKEDQAVWKPLHDALLEGDFEWECDRGSTEAYIPRRIYEAVKRNLGLPMLWGVRLHPSDDPPVQIGIRNGFAVQRDLKIKGYQ